MHATLSATSTRAVAAAASRASLGVTRAAANAAPKPVAPTVARRSVFLASGVAPCYASRGRPRR